MSTLWCKGCGIYIGMCPRGVLEFDKNIKANIVPVIRASTTGVEPITATSYNREPGK